MSERAQLDQRLVIADIPQGYYIIFNWFIFFYVWLIDKYTLFSFNYLGRSGDEADMAGIALYLASRAGAWVTGSIIKVDGGMSLNGKELGKKYAIAAKSKL